MANVVDLYKAKLIRFKFYHTAMNREYEAILNSQGEYSVRPYGKPDIIAVYTKAAVKNYLFDGLWVIQSPNKKVIKPWLML